MVKKFKSILSFISMDVFPRELKDSIEEVGYFNTYEYCRKNDPFLFGFIRSYYMAITFLVASFYPIIWKSFFYWTGTGIFGEIDLSFTRKFAEWGVPCFEIPTVEALFSFRGDFLYKADHFWESYRLVDYSPAEYFGGLLSPIYSVVSLYWFAYISLILIELLLWHIPMDNELRLEYRIFIFQGGKNLSLGLRFIFFHLIWVIFGITLVLFIWLLLPLWFSDNLAEDNLLREFLGLEFRYCTNYQNFKASIEPSNFADCYFMTDKIGETKLDLNTLFRGKKYGQIDLNFFQNSPEYLKIVTISDLEHFNTTYSHLSKNELNAQFMRQLNLFVDSKHTEYIDRIYLEQNPVKPFDGNPNGLGPLGLVSLIISTSLLLVLAGEIRYSF